MDLSLKVFITVAEKQNFTRAAEALHMTQPAVSQHIGALERQLGTKLLERSNKFVRLNKAGEIVYHHAREISGLYGRMQYLIDDLKHTAYGNLSIGASYTYGEYVLPHVVAEMMKLYPGIRPAITIGNSREIEAKVGGHELDIGIIEGEFRDAQFRIEPIADDAMVIVIPAGHKAAGRVGLKFSDLREETWIIREPGSGTREATDKMFVEQGFYPERLMEFGSTQIIKESVEAGLGISFLSRAAVRKEIALGTLREPDVEGFPFTRKFSLITRTAPFYTKAMEVFMELLRRSPSI
ncbi:LysR family transcriptional regulator [Paenibacillus macerans]|uniref:Bacterial regulatory helix-turn-helix, lysR family protein n=1 Tax=Paenibacillus macerans TaxID=44252 RepID=A0A090XH44_PAEMA|nr:LysR family transcriptional regulator [Paenibacillus macerans]KFM83737.1 bacterial regulatory helix-turn-helix, lysR family protein [Paenibacillus macerans]MCY7559678.1 LysR family transcriptional regulator [Paenibacillus macerans]MEC0135618.1 LysR family transcriptional regulator [Paenibacillus macerans]MEC0149886.1 LysR family transcriptional regulator [Paenibacillus macerans]MEC0329549.1 LysR family transcriptional regulator [Paenibacillus macerans]